MLMMVAVNPTEHDAAETLCSLQFASRVRGLELGPAHKNVTASVDIKQLRGQVSSLQAEADTARSEAAQLRKQVDTARERNQVRRRA